MLIFSSGSPAVALQKREPLGVTLLPPPEPRHKQTKGVDEFHRVEKAGFLFLFIIKFSSPVVVSRLDVIIPNSLMVDHTNSDVEIIPNCLTGDCFFSEN